MVVNKSLNKYVLHEYKYNWNLASKRGKLVRHRVRVHKRCVTFTLIESLDFHNILAVRALHSEDNDNQLLLLCYQTSQKDFLIYNISVIVMYVGCRSFIVSVHYELNYLKKIYTIH